MTTFKPGDRVRCKGWEPHELEVLVAEPDINGQIVAKHPDGSYVRLPNVDCTLLPPKVYADIWLDSLGQLAARHRVHDKPMATRALGRISWDGETLAVEP